MQPDRPLAIEAQGVGKRHGRQWVLRHLDLDIPAGSSMVLLGANGSGKSSLLRMLCGFDAPSEGAVAWHRGDHALTRYHVPGHMAYCAPDQSLILDLTVREHIEAHRRFRASFTGMDTDDVLRLALLEGHPDSRVRDLSSGMRQRLSLSLAFTTASAALFLDEPVSHLDRDGRAWYANLLAEWRRGRTLVVASNHNPEEHPKDSARFEIGN